MLDPSSFFKCISDPTRLALMLLIKEHGSLCVCELSFALNLSQPKTSRHLSVLRSCGLLKDTRRAQWMFYELGSLEDWSLSVLDQARLASSHLSAYTARLNAMDNRPQACC